MQIWSLALWVTETNAWLVAPGPGGPAVLIDVPPDPQPVIDLLTVNDLYLEAMVVTHGHVDHIGGAGDTEEHTGAVTYVHPDDDFLSLDPAAQVRALFGVMLPGSYRPPTRRHLLSHGDRPKLAGVEFEVRHTPGHTPGHCCFYLADQGWLFSGDLLFAGSVGRTDLPGGDYHLLRHSIATQVLTLPDQTRVLPGHGPETTVGRERDTNPFL